MAVYGVVDVIIIVSRPCSVAGDLISMSMVILDRELAY